MVLDERFKESRLKRRGKMSAVKLIKAIGRALTQLWSWSWSIIKLAARAVKRLRPVVPGAVIAVLATATIAGVVWLHSAARTSPDAWPSAVAAGTTATLALVTLWYAYLTHRLLEAQRSAPRTAGWETALRDLSLYLNRERAVIWTASDFFPIDRPGVAPPRTLWPWLIPESHSSATWDDAQQAHEASHDPERSEAWADIANGRYFLAAEQSWDDLSTAVDNHLVDPSR